MMRALFDLSEGVPALLLSLNALGLVVAAGASAISIFATGMPARVRYVVMLAAFVVAALLPLASAERASGSSTEAAQASTAQVEARTTTAPPSLAPRVIRIPRAQIFDLLVLLAWLSGSAALLIREFRAVVELQRRKKEWRLAPPDFAMGLGSATAIYLSRSDGPAAFGIWRRSIVLPETWVTSLSPDTRMRILRHELDHVRWLDVPVACAVLVLRAVLWPSVALWWLARLVTTEREIAADEVAVGLGSASAFDYATDLLAAAQLASPRGQLAVGAFGQSSILHRRVSYLLSDRAPRWSSVVLTLAAASLSAVAIVVLPAFAPLRWPTPSVAIAANASADYRAAAAVLNTILSRTQPRDFTADARMQAELHRFAQMATRAPLSDALSNENPRTREAAAWIAGELHDLQLAPALAVRLQDSDSDVRRAARWALDRFRRPAPHKGEVP